MDVIKGAPLPPPSSRRKKRLGIPWNEMSIGDSVIINTSDECFQVYTGVYMHLDSIRGKAYLEAKENCCRCATRYLGNNKLQVWKIA